MRRFLGCLMIVTIFFLLQPVFANAAKYVLSDPSELSFNLVTEKNLYSFTATKYIDPDTKTENLYAKIIETKVESFTCEGHNIALANNIINDGYIVTKDYGKMKIGYFGYPPTVRVWLTQTQLKALKALKSKRK